MMVGSLQRSVLPGALLAALLVATPAQGKDVYKPFLDPAIPHHAAILDTLAKLEKSPGDPHLYNDLGCLVAWDGFWRDALRNFEKAAELAPKDSRPWFNAGLVEALRGEWGPARSRFRKAVRVDPGNWSAWWMLGFSEESLGHEDAAVDAYSRSLRVDTSLFDPKYNPFAVATRLKARVLLETYERRRVDAALPFSNQMADPSRIAAFFQARSRVPAGTVQIEEPPRTGPVVTSVPPPSTVSPRPVAPGLEGDLPFRRRRAYAENPGRQRTGPVETAPEAPRQPPDSGNLVSPGPGFGEGSGAPGTGVPAAGAGARRQPLTSPGSGPGPGGAPPPTGTPGPGGAPPPGGE